MLFARSLSFPLSVFFTGSYFASHFIMGGEKFDSTHPEGYLFGENTDLNFLGNRPVAVCRCSFTCRPFCLTPSGSSHFSGYAGVTSRQDTQVDWLRNFFSLFVIGFIDLSAMEFNGFFSSVMCMLSMRCQSRAALPEVGPSSCVSHTGALSAGVLFAKRGHLQSNDQLPVDKWAFSDM